MAQYGFFPASGTDYSYGQEPELATRLAELGKALKLHLIGISGYRSPAHSVEVGGFANDPHTRGQASDTPGIESVPEATLRRFGLTRPFGGTAELDHIQLLGGARGTTKATRQPRTYTLADYWTQAGGRRALAPLMAAIAMAESGGVADRVGGPNTDGSYDYGLWQINSSHTQFDHAKLLADPLYNARAAVAIERSQGLGAWTTYKSGAYQGFMGSGRTTVPTPGRTRPGGDTSGSGAGGSADGADTAFASYLDEGAATDNVAWVIPGTPLVLPFNPLDVFKGASGAVSDTTSFLKWVAWIFHPRNVLRMVEFLTGLTIMLVGIHTAIQVHKDGGGDEGSAVGRTTRKAAGAVVEATPVGRGVRVAKGVRSGKQAAKAATRRKEYEAARKRGKQQGAKREDKKARQRFSRESRRSRDEVPF